MRFNLQLHTDQPHAVLPINYQYPLSSAIYKIISRADEEYATFLHHHGYQVENSLKGFKLFTFSDIRTPFTIQGDRLLLKGNQASFITSFHIPNAAENFIKGLFMHQEIDIADRISKAIFHVLQIESVPVIIGKEEAILKPLSPIVCGKKNEKGNYDFLHPDDPDFCKMLLLNWQEKIKAVYNTGEEPLSSLRIETSFFKQPPKSRLITIKANTPAETKIKGYVNFKLKLSGEKRFIELLVNSGVGLYNAMGMGCVEIVT